VGWFPLEARLQMVPRFGAGCIPDGDVIVATWWETAYFVAGFPRAKGEKYYLVQHYETWGGPARRVDRTYRLGLRNIVNSSWLKQILEKRLEVPVEALILHSPDLEQFYPQPPASRGRGIRILMPYRRHRWKGLDVGFRAFEAVRRRHPDVRLVLFGLDFGDDVPAGARCHRRPVGDQLRGLYNSCDIFVFPSRKEGFGMPPMEAMACARAVVTTRVGAVADYAVEGETALVCPPGDPDCLARSIGRLIDDPALRRRIARAGYRHVTRHFGWEKSARQLEAVFLKNHLHDRR